MLKWINIIAVIGFIQIVVIGQDDVALRLDDRIRLKEARAIAEKYSDQIWPQFHKTPFTILLITDNYEYLIDHPSPSEDFESLGFDEYLNVPIHYRPQSFNKTFLATFPAVNGVNCVVIGTPENTGLNSTEWIITLLHEHFHQYQYNAPNYHQDAFSLGLANGDSTGMWQINYPFPYESSVVNEAYNRYTLQLSKTIEQLNTDLFQTNYEELSKAREQLKDILSDNDYRYLAFQWFQEGVARFTEYAFLECLQSEQKSLFQPTSGLGDFIPYKDYITTFYERHTQSISTLQLREVGRITAYDVGFAEALICRKVNPNWTNEYLLKKFDLILLH